MEVGQVSEEILKLMNINPDSKEDIIKKAILEAENNTIDIKKDIAKIKYHLKKTKLGRIKCDKCNIDFYKVHEKQHNMSKKHCSN